MERKEDNGLKELHDEELEVDNDLVEDEDLEDEEDVLPETMGCLDISKVSECISRYSALCIQKFLEDILEEPVDVVFHLNRHRLVRTTKVEGRLRLQIHCAFADAPDAILVAIAKMFRGDSSEKPMVRNFIATNQPKFNELIARGGRRIALVPEGTFFDLRVLYDIVVEMARSILPEEVFENYEKGSDPDITWGRKRKKRIVSSIQLGSYSRGINLIRINPLLDREFVPDFMVESVIFHEYLHFLLPDMWSASGRRRIVHPPVFHELEQLSPFYEASQAWRRKYLKVLVKTGDQ